jgi:carboxypeptidase Taq
VKTLKTVEALTTRLLEIQRINSAAALLSWDQETHMPAGGGEARAEQISTLQGIAHQKFVSPEIERLLDAWVEPESGAIRESPGDGWDEPARSLLREVWRDYSRAKKLPSDFVMTLSRECSLAQQVWVEAKEHRAFSKFLPNLRTVLSLKREEAEYLGYRDSPYNALLDVYEPGSTIAALRPLFAQVKERLVPLLKKIQQSSVQIDDSILFHTYDQARQLEFGRMILIAMGYDFERGRLDLSAHPFTTSFHPTDVRVTTRVHEHDLQSCLFSCIHEGGHGLYDQGLDPRYFGTPLGDSVSLGIHESQSRMWENCVGRSRAFWRFFYPMLQQTFHHQLRALDGEQFYAAINRVKPSLIRVEADELTYNLHIMLRFEIEQDLIEGRTRPEDLPGIWNQKMEEYLGIVPSDDAEGVLQDVHWSFGAFGYFPTYQLGNVMSVQIWEAAQAALPGLDEAFERGAFSELRTWLQEHLYALGRKLTPKETLERVVGRPLDPEPYLRYLQSRYDAGVTV